MNFAILTLCFCVVHIYLATMIACLVLPSQQVSLLNAVWLFTVSHIKLEKAYSFSGPSICLCLSIDLGCCIYSSLGSKPISFKNTYYNLVYHLTVLPPYNPYSLCFLVHAVVNCACECMSGCVIMCPSLSSSLFPSCPVLLVKPL